MMLRFLPCVTRGRVLSFAEIGSTGTEPYLGQGAYHELSVRDSDFNVL